MVYNGEIPATLVMPRVTEARYHQYRKDNIRIYGYYNRLTHQLQPLMEGTEIAYALFSPEGCLLKLAAPEPMMRRLEHDGIVAGTLWSHPSVGRNAVSIGLSSPSETKVASTVGDEHDCISLRAYAVYCTPILVFEEHIRPSAPAHLYGSVAMLVPAEQHNPDFFTNIF